MQPKLVVVDGSGRGRSYPLEDEVFTIGRQDANDLQVLEAAVSRRHCEIHRLGDDYQLRDAGSARGTFVNGVPVNRHTLAHGDFLQISTTALVFLHETPAGVPAGERDALTACSTVERRPEEIAELLHMANPVVESDVEISDDALAPGYGRLNDAVLEAIELTARREGIILDPVYTGRAMAGLISRVRRAADDQTFLFIHTGGQPAVFGYEAQLEPVLSAFP